MLISKYRDNIRRHKRIVLTQTRPLVSDRFGSVVDILPQVVRLAAMRREAAPQSTSW